MLEIREHEIPAMQLADQAFLERLGSNYLLPEALAHRGLDFTQPSVILTGRQDSLVRYEAAWALRDEFPAPRSPPSTLPATGWAGSSVPPRSTR